MTETVYKCLTCGGHCSVNEGEVLSVLVADWDEAVIAFICHECQVKYPDMCIAENPYIIQEPDQ